MGKRKVSEPGYRYAHERRRYMALSPEERQNVKRWMEAIWNSKSCEARCKNQVPCVQLEEDTDGTA